MHKIKKNYISSHKKKMVFKFIYPWLHQFLSLIQSHFCHLLLPFTTVSFPWTKFNVCVEYWVSYMRVRRDMPLKEIENNFFLLTAFAIKVYKIQLSQFFLLLLLVTHSHATFLLLAVWKMKDENEIKKIQSVFKCFPFFLLPSK